LVRDGAVFSSAGRRFASPDAPKHRGANDRPGPQAEYAACVKLVVGDLVVYGNHGVGRIAAREERTALGTTREVVVVEFGDELTVTLPLELAATQLRSVASEQDLRLVREALRDDSELSVDPWLSRRRHALNKLTRGGPVELAQMVSEGAQRERLRSARGTRSQLSSGEVEIFTKARTLLSTEIAQALGIQPAAADGWIDEQLARPA
jgi:CarD family transcriptional regulator, regulator of rRNA transcription